MRTIYGGRKCHGLSYYCSLTLRCLLSQFKCNIIFTKLCTREALMEIESCQEVPEEITWPKFWASWNWLNLKVIKLRESRFLTIQARCQQLAFMRRAWLLCRRWNLERRRGRGRRRRRRVDWRRWRRLRRCDRSARASCHLLCKMRKREVINDGDVWGKVGGCLTPCRHWVMSRG